MLKDASVEQLPGKTQPLGKRFISCARISTSFSFMSSFTKMARRLVIVKRLHGWLDHRETWVPG
jgi:hypothetical protein